MLLCLMVVLRCRIDQSGRCGVYMTVSRLLSSLFTTERSTSGILSISSELVTTYALVSESVSSDWSSVGSFVSRTDTGTQ